ncbi:DUF1285 domain-containing protein [Methylocella sp.]|uniref:DUF1285 domain-containing protein n=1 Tax=Methylocella sp. TaxID=1978226 RepID=UPI00378509E2
MAQQDDALARLQQEAGALSGEGAAAPPARPRPPPPVESWNPPYCGDVGFAISRDGRWSYGGSPITRPALARLFSTILRKDPDRYLLVTPAESVLVTVEDAPFFAGEMRVLDEDGGRTLEFTTTMGDRVKAGPDRPIRFETGDDGGLKPYVLTRGALWALVSRALVPDLVALCERRAHDGEDWLGLASGGAFFPLARAAEVDALGAEPSGAGD